MFLTLTTRRCKFFLNTPLSVEELFIYFYQNELGMSMVRSKCVKFKSETYISLLFPPDTWKLERNYIN